MADKMPNCLRFESFELNIRTGELRKDGHLIKLQDQPMKMLILLATRAGELVSRTEIQKALWSETEFVEVEHGINTAVRKVREALGDDPDRPRFIETLPRKGYRFSAPVDNRAAAPGPTASEIDPAGDLPGTLGLSRGMARGLLVFAQCGYLAMYIAALYYFEDLERALERILLLPVPLILPLVLIAAMCGIAVRLYLLSAIGLDHPATGVKFEKLFPFVVVLDGLWAASPLLMARSFGIGLALACVAALAYVPFSPRTLIRRAYRVTGDHRSEA